MSEEKNVYTELAKYRDNIIDEIKFVDKNEEDSMFYENVIVRHSSQTLVILEYKEGKEKITAYINPVIYPIKYFSVKSV